MDLKTYNEGYYGYLDPAVREAIGAMQHTNAVEIELTDIARAIDASGASGGQMIISDDLGVAMNTLEVGLGGATFLGGVGLTGNVHFTNVPTHADDAAAGTAGVPSGMIYKTATGDLKVKL